MGNLSVIVEQANLVRKRRISYLLACRKIGQLQNIYGAATLLAGMETQIIFGGANKETASYFSSLAGNQTKTIETEAYRAGQSAQKRKPLSFRFSLAQVIWNTVAVFIPVVIHVTSG